MSIVRISYDADHDYLQGLIPGEVVDGHLDDETEAIASLIDEDGDEQAVAWRFTRGPGGPLIGFGVHHAFELPIEDDRLDALWSGPRFDVPSLALRDATVGAVVLAARHTIVGSTPDVVYFDLAVAAGAADAWDEAQWWWRACLETGEMKAHYGLGYTLVELDRPREALGHLMHYTEICPRNAWAWQWRGQAAEAAGEREEAIASYRRAVACEDAGSYETDAAERLAALGAAD